MKCISSPALDNTQILSFVEGEADDATVTHIRECPYCRERAQQWTRLQKRLRKQFYRVSCPTPMELGDYQLGYLPAPQALVVSQHLRECSLCRRELGDLENFLVSLAPESSLLGAAKVLIARLVNAQSENGQAPAVLRGETKGPLTFEVDGTLIVLDIQPASEGKFNLLGQVAAEDQEKWMGAQVELRRGDQLECFTTIDDLGAFWCEGIVVGKQELRLIPTGGSLVVVSNLEF